MKKFFISALIIFTCSTLFAFDWPQDNLELKTIKSYFGQNRGNKISTSMIFSEPETVFSSEEGKILISMSTEEDESVFFPSALGTCVIISHDDELLSVYGNLDTDSVNEKLNNKTQVIDHDEIGMPGNTAYQKGRTSLEFQIIDTKKETAINPKLLITRTNSEIDLIVTDIYVENKNHEFFQLQSTRNFPAGTYRVYQKRNPIACPYKTTITVNGVVLDQISYDTIGQENNKIFVSGKKKYISSDIYPNNNLQLIGETVFTPGKTTLGLLNVDFLGKSKNLNFNISVY